MAKKSLPDKSFEKRQEIWVKIYHAIDEVFKEDLDALPPDITLPGNEFDFNTFTKGVFKKNILIEVQFVLDQYEQQKQKITNPKKTVLELIRSNSLSFESLIYSGSEKKLEFIDTMTMLCIANVEYNKNHIRLN